MWSIDNDGFSLCMDVQMCRNQNAWQLTHKNKYYFPVWSISTSFDTAPYAAFYQATALEVIQKVPVLCALYVCICYWQGYTQRDILEVLVILHLVLLLWVSFINKSVCLYFWLHIYRNTICIPLPQTQNVKMAFCAYVCLSVCACSLALHVMWCMKRWAL